MAIAADRSEFAAPDIRIGPNTALAAFYILIALLSMSIAIPLAFMTADIGIFDECYGPPEVCAAP